VFEDVLGRPATSQEEAASRGVVREHGLATLCWSLFNSSEFLFLQ
jgi:hypothetical protein